MPLSTFKPDQYDRLLQLKVDALTPRFSELGAPTPEVFSSPISNFRLRAEFRIWHNGNDINYVMFRKNTPKHPVVINEFPIGSTMIQRLMPRLLSFIQPRETLRRKLFQIEFLSTLSGDLLVTLIYHRPLNDTWQKMAEQLAVELNINIVGRSRREKCVIGRDWVEETLRISNGMDTHEFYYKQPEQVFTQPNGNVNQKMIRWAQDCTKEKSSGDLLELYCGIGNFTLPLAEKFERVLATELSKVATRAAIENLQRNNIQNIEFARLSAKDMSDAIAGVRPFRRLGQLHKPLSEFQFTTLLVDPPRAGLDEQSLSLAVNFENVIYISCNPETLLENLHVLSKTHTIERLAFFDQFPYTNHMESGVLLKTCSL